MSPSAFWPGSWSSTSAGMRVALDSKSEGAAGGSLGYKSMLLPSHIAITQAVIVARVRLQPINQRFKYYASAGIL